MFWFCLRQQWIFIDHQESWADSMIADKESPSGADLLLLFNHDLWHIIIKFHGWTFLFFLIVKQARPSSASWQFVIIYDLSRSKSLFDLKKEKYLWGLQVFRMFVSDLNNSRISRYIYYVTGCNTIMITNIWTSKIITQSHCDLLKKWIF